jgi:hypothetical protein
LSDLGSAVFDLEAEVKALRLENDSLKAENYLLKQSLSHMVKGVKDALPLLKPEPEPEVLTIEPQSLDTTLPPSMEPQQDGAYRVDVSSYKSQDETFYQTYEY